MGLLMMLGEKGCCHGSACSAHVLKDITFHGITYSYPGKETMPMESELPRAE